ncbi:hypothetical protein ACMFMG_012061 [Clarireedia jacksonii]
MSACISDTEDVRELSAFIATQTAEYTKALASYKDSKSSAFDQSHKSERDLEKQALVIANACKKLESLLVEPSVWMVKAAWSYCDSAAICLAIDMGLPQHIKLGQEATSLTELVEKTGGSAPLIKRVLRQCVHGLIFEEQGSGYYRHNRNSECLLSQNISSLIHYLVDDGMLCGAYLSKTMRRTNFKITDSPHEAAFCAAFETKLSLYEYYHSVDQDRGKRFASAMAGHYDSDIDKPVESIYPFAELRSGTVVVDVGGGLGQNSLRLASKYPQLSCIVQDHESVTSTAKKAVPNDLLGRVTWQAHDFYTSQPVKGADIYLISHVLMDHTDEECCRILSALVEAMDQERSMILIHDFVDPPTTGAERPEVLDMLDLHMIASLNTHSRDQQEWKTLVASTSRRLFIKRTWFGAQGSAVLELKLQ